MNIYIYHMLNTNILQEKCIKSAKSHDSLSHDKDQTCQERFRACMHGLVQQEQNMLML